MPDFQFTPILTVVTNDEGILTMFDWDWSDSGQGEYNPLTCEHDATSRHESVCAQMDKLSAEWLPASHPHGPGSAIGSQMHEPVDRVTRMIDTIEDAAAQLRKKADELARANNPGVANVGGISPEAMLLERIAAEVRLAISPREYRIGKIREEPEDPDPAYRWKVDLALPWLRDEDNEARYELVPGVTKDDALARAKAIGEAFVAAGDLEPGEWPKGL